MEFITEFIEALVAAPFICVGWVIVGAIAGDIARRLMKSPDQNVIADIILGIIGAVIGGFVAGLLDIGRPDGGIGLVIVNLIIATVAAAALIWIKRALSGRARSI